VSVGEELDGAGDNTPDTAALVHCPYCDAPVELLLDSGGGVTADLVQEYVEDCQVCCRPWQISVRWDPSGGVSVEARTDED
jgi:hypothetical protein